MSSEAHTDVPVCADLGTSLRVSSDSTACVDLREGGRKMEGTVECDIVLRDLFPIHRVAPNAPLGEQWLTLANLPLIPTGFLGRERASQATSQASLGQQSITDHLSEESWRLGSSWKLSWLKVEDLVWLHLTEDLCW